MTPKLFLEPEQFDFFQAVRLLEQYYKAGGPGGRREPVGRDARPDQEMVRFRALPALSFPGCAITSLNENPGEAAAAGKAPSPAEMMVSFLGLTGPNGVLPQHYTTLLLERLRQKDPALREFFDLFNHRAISHFYRAWQKYRFPFNVERCFEEGTTDLFTQSLFCMIGMGTDGLRDRLEVDDDALLLYAGHFSNQRRSANSLEVMLADYFGVPLGVQQFCGQWLYLDQQNRSLLGNEQRGAGQNAALGTSAMLGRRVWDVQSKFRVYVGPLTYRQFCRFMPSGNGLLPLVQLTRAYVGTEFDFDVQLALQGEQVPRCLLGAQGLDRPRVGWNTWLRAKAIKHDVSDAVFAVTAV